ncbi:CarboxypepD_reg-like domain protein [uncultured archaeon]|nr:CarboxypepD_reg-like domain protein [uncultured archaeon]
MNKKIYIIVILAIIVTTLSQTVSFISGEHQFYQSVQDKCTKCHGDIKAQLSMSTNHSSSSCDFCHVKSATNHTNTNPACQDCHNTTQKLNDSLEAHTDFSSMGSKGCIACHTTYNALVNYSRAEYIDYTITNNNGNWIISSITTIGTLNLSYNAQRTGGDHDIQNVSCRDCHEDIFEAVSLGGHAVVLAKNSTNITNGTQVPYHDNSNTTLEAWCRTCHSRNDANFSTQQHSVRKTTCEECHQAYNSTPHPGNFFANINMVPHLYRSLVCISCHSIGWPAPNGGIHFKVHQEPYFDVTYEIIAPLLIINSTPANDPTTTVGTAQAFSITLNRPADIYWYNNGSEIFRALGVISSSYSSSNAGIGAYNITATADDGSATASRTWNWTVTNQTGNGTGGGGGGGSIPVGKIITGSATGPSGSNNISGYVFDNNVLALPGVLVQNGSYQNTTNISGYYSMTGLPNGTYTFSYSKAGFDTGYSVFTLNGASVENVNVIIYDTTPPASVSNINTAGGNFYINNTWTNPADADFNYTWFRYDNGTTLQSVNSSTDYLNLTWSPHYTQNISAQTVDTYNNINPTQVWFNSTVPNNAPVQLQIGNKTVDEGQPLNFTVSATDADNDTITYGTSATKGDFNSTTGNFSWIPTYGDAGVYYWYFNSSDNYGGISTENIAVTVNNVPLSITNSSPVSDPATIVGSSQTFSITLNRTADIIWYNNGSEAFRVLNVTSATYINSTAGVGTYNITAFANDSHDSVSRSWNWSVTPNINGTNVSGGGDGGGGSGGSNNSVSGYVFDNFGLSLGGVLVQNGSYQNTTDASGYYSIANLSSGTYNFSYSRAGFNTAYFEFTLNGAVVMNANRTLYDIMPAAPVSNPSMTTGNFYVNNTWINPIDVDFNYTWFRYSNDTTLQNVSKPVNYLNLTWQPHYTQNISAQTVDTSGNVNQTKIWFNTTIPNNVPFQYAIGNKVVNENENLQFNVTATDADNDTITYGTNASKGTFNTTTGNFSWTPGYGDAGFYFWNFNSSDGYGGTANENVAVTVISVPLSITSSSPVSDPITIIGTTQAFGITLNRTANVTWYINSSVVQSNLSVVSANYTNSTAGIGGYNVTAIANDSYNSASRTWNWTVSPQPTHNISGYVFDNYGSGLGSVLVKNESGQNTTLTSGYYLITGLLNGTYNFSYSRPGFNTGYLEVTINGADNTSANTTIYDTTPPASVSNTTSATGNFYINNTWVNPTDADFNYTWFRYSNGTNLQNVSSPVSYLNLTWSPHYTQNISAQTVDTYGNINQTEVWFNATIPNNPPVQSLIGNRTITAGSLLQFNVTATDADSDQITYGTNATNGTLNSTTGAYSWQTNNSDAGTYIWYFNSSDNYGGVASETITVTVTLAPSSKYIPPIPINLTSTQGNFWINNSWQAGAGNATDSYNVSVNGSWMNGTTNTYHNNTVGPHGWSNITVWAYNNSDGGSLSSAPVSQSTQVANNAPLQITIGNKSVDEGQWLNFTVNATDVDNDTITYGTNATKGSFNTTTGNFSWMPSYGDAGIYTWYFNSSDGFGGVASETIILTVGSVPLSITSSSPAGDPTTTVGTAQTFGITLNRTANVTWYINGSAVQTNSSVISANYTNSTAGAGIYNVTVAATDGYDSVSKQWNWTVSPQPVYAPGITSWNNNKTNNNSLTFAINASEVVNFNATANQTITIWNWYQDGVNQNNNYDNFTASWNTAGTKTIQVNATNSNGTSNTITWTVTVQAQPVTYIPPSPANITSITGNFWVNTTWQPGAGNTTDSYNVSVNGAWANGTTNTSVNSSLSAHAWQNVTVYAYNASGSGSLSASPATKNTQIPNNPPVQYPIGNKTVYEGQWLNFTVNATDADNDTITYGTNATKGSFNATTGNFSWLTTYSDAGTYVWYFNSSDGYGGVASETITVTVNNTLLSIASFSPPSDPTTTQGTAQTFNVTLNRNANVTWYMNGAQVQTDIGTTSASYTN